MRIIQKPFPDEYPPYSEIYMGLIPGDGLVLKYLKENVTRIKKLVYSLPEEKLCYRYAPGKWTVKEILVHLIDDERIFSYRTLRYARNDPAEVEGFEQDDYAVYSNANERSLESIFDEYETVRNATISLFEYLPDDCLMRTGTMTGNVNRRSVRAMAYHIAGHEQWHINIIKERYL
jgi:hypothetical protein